MEIIEKHLRVKRLSPVDDKHYWFGYFDKQPWDSKGERLLAHQASFTARQPRYSESATVGILQNGVFTPLTETLAWNWQQGSMLQWFSDHEIIYNDIEGTDYCSRILDLDTAKIRTFARPIYCLTPDRAATLSLNFARLDRERPGYGYTGVFDPSIFYHYSDDDGIWRLDFAANRAELIVSLAQIVHAFPRDGMVQNTSWFNHLLCSPDGRRFAFFHRWRTATYQEIGARKTHLTHMFTANLDGTEIHPLNLEDMSSHYAWISSGKIINFSRRFRTGDQYHLFSDRTDDVEVVARDVFPGDGHCTFSPDHRWMLTDTYPLADHCRRLYLYDLTNKQAYEIGSFYADPAYISPTRCDLHPRWSPDGTRVCFDSIHEGGRAIYSVDVTPVTQI